MLKPGLNCLLHVSATRGKSDYTMGRGARVESSGEILGANYGEMILDRKHFSFLEQVIDRDHLNTADGCTEGRVFG